MYSAQPQPQYGQYGQYAPQHPYGAQAYAAQTPPGAALHPAGAEAAPADPYADYSTATTVPSSPQLAPQPIIGQPQYGQSNQIELQHWHNQQTAAYMAAMAAKSAPAGAYASSPPVAVYNGHDSMAAAKQIQMSTPAVTTTSATAKPQANRRTCRIVTCVAVVLVIIIVAAVVAGVLASRNKGSPNGSSGGVTVAGVVTSAANGAVVSGASVGGGSCTSATTASDGSYSVKCSNSGPTIVFQVNGSSLGAAFVPHVHAVRVGSSLINYHVPVALNSFTVTNTFSPLSGIANVALAGASFTGTSYLSVPALSAAQMSATDAPAQALLRAALIPVASSPGLMQSDTPEATTGSTALQSGGMYYYDLVDAATQQTQWSLPAGMAVIVSSNIELPTIPATGTTMFYGFSHQTGLWTNPQAHDDVVVQMPHASRMSLMSVNGNSTAVHHMSTMQGVGNGMAGSGGYWNSDRAYKTACVITTIQSSSGAACAGSSATATGPDNLHYSGVTGADGSTCLEGAQTRSSTLNVGGSTATVNFPATAGTCSSPSSCQHVTVTAKPNPSNCPSQSPPVTPNYNDCINTLQALVNNEQQAILTPCENGDVAQCCSAVESFANQYLAALEGVCAGLESQYPELQTDISALEQAIQELDASCAGY